MVNLETVRLKAARLASRHPGLGAGELRTWYDRLECFDPAEDNWPVFRSAYFDALWAGAEEVAAAPVISHTGFPTCKPLSGCAHLTLAFVSSRKFELIDMAVEVDEV